MNEKEVLTNVTTLDDGTNHFTTVGYAVSLYEYLWKEITEYVDNNPLEGIRNMQYHYDVLKQLEEIAYDEDAFGRERKLYQLDEENVYPTLSMLEAYEVKDEDEDLMKEMYVYITPNDVCDTCMIDCWAEGCDIHKEVFRTDLCTWMNTIVKEYKCHDVHFVFEGE